MALAADPDLFARLIIAMGDEDRAICGRAADAAEKRSADNPLLLISHAPRL